MSAHTRRRFLKHAAAGVAAGWSAAGTMPALAAAEPGKRLNKRFQPKLAICNETFGKWPLERAFGLAAECGYQGVEIAPFTINTDVTEISARQRAQIRRQAQKAGLEVIGLHWLLAKTTGLHLTSPDKSVRRKTAQYLGALAGFCAELGGKLLVFGSPRQRNLLPGVTPQQAMGYAAEVIRAALPVFEKAGVVLALEPLAPGVTTFMSTAAEAVALIKLVDSPLCLLNLDCLAMTTESKPIPELIRTNRQWLAHFHANDPNRQGPGFGKLDFVPIFEALQEVDYRGWVSVEVFDYRPGPERLARESIRYVQKCLAKVNAP